MIAGFRKHGFWALLPVVFVVFCACSDDGYDEQDDAGAAGAAGAADASAMESDGAAGGGGSGGSGASGASGGGGTADEGGVAGASGAAGSSDAGGAPGEGGVAGASGASGSSGAGGTAGEGVDAGIWGTLPQSGLLDVLDEPVEIPDPGGGTVTCYPITCNEKLLECANCEDDDGDGLIDAADPECLGPCDNTEGPVLAPGVGGETGSQCKPRDCFFDFGNGPGNDDCYWGYFCDPLAPKASCPYEEDEIGGTDCPDGQSDLCLQMCLPITPNGCDCFGCCTFPELEGMGEDGEDGHVWIGHMDEPGCTLESVSDPEACPPCTPEPSCWNTCGRCEICLGKPTIPDDCFETTPDGGTAPDGGTTLPDGGTTLPDGGTTRPDGGTARDGGGASGRCPPGLQACGLPTDPLCPRNTYCITGCCITVVE